MSNKMLIENLCCQLRQWRTFLR